MALSTSKIIQSAVSMFTEKHHNFPAEHLDIGAGHGDLIVALRSKFELKSSACDYTDSLMKLDDVRVSIADLNVQGLPYEDEQFDVVTCTEVIEHLEHYRFTIREIFRVLKSGGTLVITTPNILNLKSRIRYLVFGFYNLFGPLHVRESRLHETGGHINPVTLFFLAHALLDAGFEKVSTKIDKRQGTSEFWLIFLYVPIKIFGGIAFYIAKNKYKAVDSYNQEFILQINSLDILLGRTIVVGCKKPIAVL